MVSLVLPMAAASVMSRTACSVIWPGALMRAPMAVMSPLSPLSAPVPVAVMVTLRPASMAEAAGVVVLVTFSNRLWLAPTLALMDQPPQPAPVTGLAMLDRLLGLIAYTNGGMTFQSLRPPVAQSIAKKTPTLTMSVPVPNDAVPTLSS